MTVSVESLRSVDINDNHVVCGPVKHGPSDNAESYMKTRGKGNPGTDDRHTGVIDPMGRICGVQPSTIDQEGIIYRYVDVAYVRRFNPDDFFFDDHLLFARGNKVSLGPCLGA